MCVKEVEHDPLPLTLSSMRLDSATLAHAHIKGIMGHAAQQTS